MEKIMARKMKDPLKKQPLVKLMKKVDKLNDMGQSIEKSIEQKFIENQSKPLSEIISACSAQISEDLKDMKVIDIDI